MTGGNRQTPPARISLKMLGILEAAALQRGHLVVHRARQEMTTHGHPCDGA